MIPLLADQTTVQQFHKRELAENHKNTILWKVQEIHGMDLFAGLEKVARGLEEIKREEYVCVFLMGLRDLIAHGIALRF